MNEVLVMRIMCLQFYKCIVRKSAKSNVMQCIVIQITHSDFTTKLNVLFDFQTTCNIILSNIPLVCITALIEQYRQNNIGQIQIYH